MQFFSHSLSLSKNVFLFALFCLSLSISIRSQTNLPASSNKAQTAVSKLSPSQVVIEFYNAMRELRFREALMLTNLKPAVENLTVQEVEDLRSDFEAMASQVPEKIETSNERITGNSASVLIKAQSMTTSGQPEAGEINLRRENDDWIILSGDAEAEAAAKKEGKNYFYKLHFDLRHSEVEGTLQDIIKAQIAFSLQNKGMYADLPVFVDQGTVTGNVLKPETYGYKFKLTLSPDKKKYMVNAEPTVYGKTGKLSFLLISGDPKTGPRILHEDKAGAAITAQN